MTSPLRFAYADPPYLGQSKRHYGNHPDYAGEVNHPELIRSLEQDYDGFALSASMKSLAQLLTYFNDDVLVLAWFKTIAPPLGDHRRYSWEPVVLRPVRRYGPGYVPTALIAAPPQFTFRDTPESHVIGEKPEAFCHWVFANAGLTKDDTLVDLFPGSGAVTRAWKTYEPGPTMSDGYTMAKVGETKGGEPDYEAAARAYRHVDEPHVMAHVCKVVDAAIGDKLLINPPTEEETT